nr:hypothetical protein [Tanacetum cinerariifolium]
DSANSGSLERPPPLDSHEAIVAPQMSRVALRSSSEALSPSLSIVIVSPTPCWIVPAPPGVPRRPAILVLPDSSSSDTSSKSFSFDSLTSLSERSLHPVTTHSPSSSSRPSHKRCRSSATLGPSVVLSSEDSSKGSMEACSKEDIDSDVMAEIEANISTEDTMANEISAETEDGFEGDDEAEERAGGVRCHLSYVQEELRLIRSSRYYNMMDFRGL